MLPTLSTPSGSDEAPLLGLLGPPWDAHDVIGHSFLDQNLDERIDSTTEFDLEIQCRENPNGRWTMQERPEIICWTDEHRTDGSEVTENDLPNLPVAKSN